MNVLDSLALIGSRNTLNEGRQKQKAKCLPLVQAVFFKRPIKCSFEVFQCTICHRKISINDQFYWRDLEEREQQLMIIMITKNR